MNGKEAMCPMGGEQDVEMHLSGKSASVPMVGRKGDTTCIGQCIEATRSN